MLAPRPVKLRSQRDVNLWRIPLRVSLGGHPLVRPHPDPRHPRRVQGHPHPVVADDGQHRRRAGDPVGDDGRGRDRARADLLGRAARAVDGGDAVRAAPLVSLPAGLGDAGDDRPVHGDVHLRLPVLPGHAPGRRLALRPADLAAHELGSRRRQLRVPRLLQPPDRDVDPEPRHDRARSWTTSIPAVVGSHERAAGEGTGELPDDDAILRRAEAGAQSCRARRAATCSTSTTARSSPRRATPAR